MFLIDSNVTCNKLTRPEEESSARNFSKTRLQNFNNSLSVVDWSPLYLSTGPDASLQIFVKIFTDLHDNISLLLK